MSMMQGRGMAQPGNMLGGAPFMQGIPQSGQQQLPPNHMQMQPNTNHANPAMMNAANMTPAQRQQQQHQHQQYLIQQQQQQQNDMRRMSMQVQPPGQPGRPMINPMGPSGGGVVGAGGQPMAGMGQNPGMQFNPAMVGAGAGGPAAVRRVSSQPNLGQAPGGPMVPIPGAMPVSVPGMVAQGGVNRQMNPGMMQNAVRIGQQSPHANMAGAMAGMNMDRPNAIGTPGAMPGPQGGRPIPPQPQGIMGSLSQPPPSFSQMGNPQTPFPNTPGPQPAQVPSPARTGNHTPMSMATPGPSHTPVNRQSMGPDEPLFSMGMPNQQFNRPPNHQMPPTVNGNPFPNVGGPSSSPSVPNPDQQSMPPQMMGRGTTYPTPAQQFEQMNNNSNSESFGNPQHFSMGPPPIPRPPSRHPPTPHGVGTPQQAHLQMRQSPHPPPDGHMGMHPARPQSQPQNQPAPRPPSRQPQPQTPRTAHQQPPTAGSSSQGGRPGTAGGSSSGPMPSGMTPGGGPQQGPPTMPGANPGPPHMGPRPGPIPQPPQLNPSTQRPNPQQAANPNPAQPGPSAPTPAGLDPNSATNPQSPSFDPTRVLGSGQGLMRLLQFSGALASDDPEATRQKGSIKFWDHLMGEYFTPKAQMKITLWKDNQRTEAKPFHITVPVLSRFFLVTTQSGVKSMNLSLDGARERMYNDGHSMVECLGAIWTYKYYNGYSVTLRGPLTVHVIIHVPPPNDPITKTEGFPGYMLKFDEFQFNANFYDKYVLSDVIAGLRTTLPRSDSTPLMSGQHMTQQQAEDAIWEEPRIGFNNAWIPGEPVNAFGIPQATMRCLELAESVSHMEELITFSRKHNLGPLEALQKYAARLKETNGGMYPPLPIMNGVSGNDFNPMHGIPNPHLISAPVTLYSSAPASITNPQSIGTPSSSVTANTASPQNAPPSASSSPQKQHKTIPGGTPSLANATSPAMSSGATNTPAMSNASLKRKGGDATSPAQGNEPASKRNRKRRGTTSGS